MVDAFVGNIIMPVVGIIGGQPTFDEYTLTVNGSIIAWGSFVTALVSFVIIAAALFVFIRAFERLQQLRRSAADVDEEELSVSEELLAEIRDLLKAQEGGGSGRTSV